MLRLSVRSVLAHWRRFVLTTVAVVVGVSFVVGSFVLTDSLASSINALLSEATSHTDFVVAPANGGGRGPRVAFGGGGGGGVGGGGGRAQVARVPADLLTTLAAVPGVVAVDATVAGPAALLDKAGNAKAYDVAVLGNWPDHPDMSALRLTSGHAPRADGDVVVDTATASDRNLTIGSKVRIATLKGVVVEHVSGLAERGAGNLGAAGQVLDVSLARATDLVGTAGKVGGISVRVAPNVDRTAMAATLQTAVGPDQSILSAQTLLADAQARIQDRLGTFNSLMLGFAAVTLFVSAFLIWNTFSTVVASRTRELALLRAVGASPNQVFASVFAEGALVGVFASVVGIIAGIGVAIGLRSILGAFGIDLPSTGVVLAFRSIGVGVGVGLGVTVVSVLGPALRSARVAPMAAMSAAALPLRRSGRAWPWIGSVAFGAGLAFGAWGLLQTTATLGQRLTHMGIGAALVFGGVAMLSRYLAGPLIGAIGSPFGRLGGVASKLARQNAVRDPRRTASTALALTIGIALVATTLVLGESVKTAYGGALRQSINADIVVNVDSVLPFDPTTVADVAKAPGVSRSVPLPFARARLLGVDRGRIGLTTGDVSAISKVVDPSFVSGGYPTDDTHIAVSKSFADDQHLKLGQTITVESGDPGGFGGNGNGGNGNGGGAGTTTTTVPVPGAPAPVTAALTISGIYLHDEVLDDSVVSSHALAAFPDLTVSTKIILVQTSGDPATVAHRLAEVAAGIPNSAAQLTDDYVNAQTNALDLVLGIVDVLLFFAVLVAGLGIANTLALSVVERTRELGLLRAVGMDRRSMRRMVRIEGVLVALFGGVMGLAVGIGFGAAVAGALPVDSAVLSMPYGRLALLFVAAAVLGIVSSALPARRAARLDVLAAVAET